MRHYYLVFTFLQGHTSLSVYQKMNTDSLFHLVLKRRVNVCEVALNIGNVALLSVII